MEITDYATAWLEAVGNRHLEEMRPADRQRLADQCRRVLRLCDRVDAPRAGVLAELRDGRPD